MTDKIYPTHDCFTDSLELLDELLRAALQRGIDARPDLRLIHAICAFPNGELFSHAWVEDGKKDMAMSYGIRDGKREVFGARPIAGYRAHYDCREAITYTYDEAIEQNRIHGHYGPWVTRIRARCSGERRVVYPDAEKQ